MATNMQPTISYEIEVAGLIDQAWEDWFEAPRIHCTVRDGQPVTRLTVQFKDQAGLIGIVRQLHGMGLKLLWIRQLDEWPEPGSEQPCGQAGHVPDGPSASS